MSGTEQESMSERELADFFATEVYVPGGPRSVGEALEAADSEETATEPVVDEPTPVVDEPVIVEDEPTERDTGEGQLPPEVPAEPELEPEEEDTEGDIQDEHVVWAKKKYGDDPTKWARAAWEQEQHISRQATKLKEAESLASDWYEYAQGIQREAQQQMQQAMPLSSQEEQWIEQALTNPYQAARQAALNGNFNLYNGVIARVAEENPLMAAQIGTQVQMEMEQLAAQENGAAPQAASLQEAMSDSIRRLGIDLETYGDPMSAKIGELGEFHPYVQTILEGDPAARDIALMAVYDLVRATAMSTRRVRSEERDEQIRHEADLRRQAAGVVTGGPVQPQPPKQSPFMDAMEEEWRARGQWSEE